MGQPQRREAQGPMSVFQVEHSWWKMALKAAEKVAGKKDPYDVIQLRLDGRKGTVVLCAVSPMATLVVDLSAQVFSVVRDRDEVVEFSRVHLGQLLKMSFAKPVEPGSEIEVGVQVGESELVCTDESGLALGIRTKSGIPRHAEPGPIGDPVRGIRRTIEVLDTGGFARVVPFGIQSDLVAKVQNAFGGARATLRQVPENQDGSKLHKLLASGPGWRLTVTATEEDKKETQDKPESVTLTVVGANPVAPA